MLAVKFGSVSHPGGTDFEGMKGSWREAEAWHCVAGLGSLKKAEERLLIKVQPNCSRDPNILGDASTTKSSSNGVKPA